MAAVDFADPAVTVWANVTAEPHVPGNPELLKQRLVEQIVEPVRWSQSCQRLTEATAERSVAYHELAPGNVLRG